jgi:hypothetical protein
VEAALLARAAHELLRDVALVEAVVRGEDRVLPALSGLERLLLGVDQLLERREEVRLAEDLARLRRLSFLFGASGRAPSEYGQSLDPTLRRSIDRRLRRIIKEHPVCRIAGARTSLSDSFPCSASMTRSPPGVPGVTAASGPYSGG